MSRYEAIVIGGSAGSLDALGVFFSDLPPEVQVPIAVVVHLPQGGPSILHEVLAHRSALKMKQAEDKEPLTNGTIYFAPPGYHLLIEADRSFSLSVDDPVQYSRPSIDVLFQSAADSYGDKLIGILLTGGSEDGAAGLESIGRRGGLSIVQDPVGAQMPFMPAAAIRRCAPSHIVPLQKLGAFTAMQFGARPAAEGVPVG